MLGKVSVQPSVGHWKVLPEQRNGVTESVPAWLHCTPRHPRAGAAPPVGLQHLPCSPHSCPVPCSTSCSHRHHQRCPSSEPCFATSQPNKGTLEGHRASQSYPRGTAWVCSGPSGGPSAPACWGRPVCSHSSSTGNASLEGDRRVGPIPVVAVTSAGQSWGWAHLGQVCASVAAGPGLGSLCSPPPASGRWVEPLRCNLRGQAIGQHRQRQVPPPA